MTGSLCTVFQVLAERTAFRHRRSHETGVWLREDGYTALNLQDLWSFRSAGLTIIDFSPFVESRETGADWEWWFEDNSGAFGAAVQAKCLKDGRFDFGYKSKGGSPQMQRLLDYCAHMGDLSPQYCLYSGLSDAELLAISWSCPSFPSSASAWGCSLLDGIVAAQLLGSGRTELQYVLSRSWPWQCIACCNSGAQSPVGMATRAFSLGQRLRAQSDGGNAAFDVSADQDSPAALAPSMQPALPNRIARLLDSTGISQLSRGQLLDEWRGELPRAVVVVR